MTQEKTDAVSAVTTKEPGEIADAVAAAQNKEPAPEVTPPATDAPPAPPGVTLADLEFALDRRQGTQNNWNASQMKRIETNLQAQLDAAMAPFKETMSALEQARVDELEPEQQVEYWKNKATAAPGEASAPPVAEQTGEFSDTQRLQIVNQVTQMLNEEGVQVNYLDTRLYEGATTTMPPEQIVQIARGNAIKIKANPAAAAPVATLPATPLSASGDPPPSTQDAPSASTSAIETKTEAAEALARNDINIDEYREIGTKNNWFRSQ